MITRLSRTHAPRHWLLFLATAAALSACGGGDNSGPTAPPGGTPPPGARAAATVTVSPNSLQLVIGSNGSLTAIARASNGSIVTTTISWQTDDAAIAAVSATGVVTAVGIGSTTVRARADTAVGSAIITVARAPAAAVAAPSALVATAGARGLVSLAWTDNSNNETGFELERRTARDTAYMLHATLAANRATFVDSSVASSDTLHYRLRAITADTVSTFASAAAIVPRAPLATALQEVAHIASRGLPDPRLPADGRNLTAELQALIPQLQRHPDVDTVLLQAATSTAQVLFHDGTSVLIIHNKVPTAAEIAAGEALQLANASFGAQATGAARQSFSSMSSAFGPTQQRRFAAAVPSTRRAVAVSLGGGEEVLPDIRRVLQGGGYTVDQLDGSVEAFRNYKGIGALYLDAHGAQFIFTKPGGGTETKYSIETTTLVSTLLADQYRSEVAAGDLTFSIVPLSKRILDELPVIDIELLRSVKFGITESFIRKHWQLNNAVVVLHTCFGGSGPFVGIDPGLIRQAMKDVGATVVMGFDNYVWPTSSLNINAYFFDRLLGANQWGPEISPDRRPFALDKVRASMSELGLLRHYRSAQNSPNTTFDTDRADAQIIGVPSIRQITVIDDAAQADGELQLVGTFSDVQGSVTIGGQSATVSSWSGTSIRARSPFGANGEVQVHAPGGLKSNDVPLTEWRGGITLRVNPSLGTLLAEAQIDVRFRADAHRVRTEVEQSPETDRITAYISPITFGRVVGTGSYHSGNGTVTWNGTREMRILDKATVDAGGDFSVTESLFGGLVTILPDQKLMQICFSLSGVIRVRGESDNGITEVDALVALVFPEHVDALRGKMSCLDLRMNDRWETPGGQRTVTADDNVTITLEWTPFKPLTPPGLRTKS